MSASGSRFPEYDADAPFKCSQGCGTFERRQCWVHRGRIAYRRGPVVAIGIVTFRHQKERAADFWGGAAADDGLVRDDPRKSLNNFLLSKSSAAGDLVAYHRHVAATWNRFYDNGTMQILRPSDTGKVGITIKGTPYKAIQRRRPAGAPASEVEVEEGPSSPAVQTVFAEYRPAP